jgi:hypothetical protein
MGVAEDVTFPIFPVLPEQVKRINTRDSEIVGRQLGGTPIFFFSSWNVFNRSISITAYFLGRTEKN